MDYLKLARRVFEIELSEVEATAARFDSGFVSAVDLIKDDVERRNTVVVLGVGKSGHIGEKIAATLT
ncbi:MAG: KpsF/GutQ family sugar-phosphate isomerase, partial [Spartobacteria bacterium]